MEELTSNKRIQTRVNSQMSNLPAIVANIASLQYYSASTTTALAASQFGTFQVVLGSNEVQQGPLGIGVLEIYSGPIEVKRQG